MLSRAVRTRVSSTEASIGVRLYSPRLLGAAMAMYVRNWLYGRRINNSPTPSRADKAGQEDSLVECERHSACRVVQ